MNSRLRLLDRKKSTSQLFVHGSDIIIYVYCISSVELNVIGPLKYEEVVLGSVNSGLLSCESIAIVRLFTLNSLRMRQKQTYTYISASLEFWASFHVQKHCLIPFLKVCWCLELNFSLVYISNDTLWCGDDIQLTGMTVTTLKARKRPLIC